MKKLFCKKGNLYFSLQEDTIGWYLIIYEDELMKKSKKGHLYDSYQETIQAAQEGFHILEKDWKETP